MVVSESSASEDDGEEEEEEDDDGGAAIAKPEGRRRTRFIRPNIRDDDGVEARSTDGSDDGSDLADFIVPDEDEDDEDYDDDDEEDDDEMDDDESEQAGDASDNSLTSDEGGDAESATDLEAADVERPSGAAEVIDLTADSPPEPPSRTKAHVIPPPTRTPTAKTPGGKSKVGVGSATPASTATPGRGTSWAATQRRLKELAPELLTEYNRRIFGGRMPADLKITWNVKLLTTAGRCRLRGNVANRHAEIELSSKVCDTEDRMRDTLVHELCHAAAWVLDGEKDPPHGPAFYKWGKTFGRHYPGMVVSRCHDYKIFYKFRYGCTACGKEFGRHSESIDLDLQRCGRCKGRLELVGRFNRDGTPYKPRAPSAFAMFVKEHFGPLKATMPGASHKELMAELGERFRAQKAAAGDDAGLRCEEVEPEPSAINLSALRLDDSD